MCNLGKGTTIELTEVAERFEEILTNDTEKAIAIANQLLPDFPQYEGCDLHLMYDIVHSKNEALTQAVIPHILAHWGYAVS